jgi:tRNA A37 methylthiotransferase MiaB
VNSDGDDSHDDGGVRFGELLLRVSELDPEMRIRFQAPHPKDFPDPLLNVISSKSNVCK